MPVLVWVYKSQDFAHPQQHFAQLQDCTMVTFRGFVVELAGGGSATNWVKPSTNFLGCFSHGVIEGQLLKRGSKKKQMLVIFNLREISTLKIWKVVFS